MRKKIILLNVAIFSFNFFYAQTLNKDSLNHQKMIEDSLKMEKLLAKEVYPVLKGSKWSGVIPVANPMEVPDKNIDYKLLFELTYNNPDSLAKEINGGLDEIARIINLHVASGIPVKKIIPVILVHGAALDAILNNESYNKKHKINNPNIKLLSDMENLGAKLIACGQAMAFFDFKKEDMLPEVKISLTAKTVLSAYQLKNYVLYDISVIK